MGVDRAMNDGEPQSGTVRVVVDAVETFEDDIAGLGRDSRPRSVTETEASSPTRMVTVVSGSE